MESIEYSEKEYTVITTEELDEELVIKLVQFNTGYYGIISENPKTKEEMVTVISPEKGETKMENNTNTIMMNGGLGCISYMTFARDAKRYLENTPIELIVKLGQDTPTEYREVITRDQAKTLYERVEICHEIMEMKLENSFHYKYGDIIMTIFMCITIILFAAAIINILCLYGVI